MKGHRLTSSFRPAPLQGQSQLTDLRTWGGYYVYDATIEAEEEQEKNKKRELDAKYPHQMESAGELLKAGRINEWAKPHGKQYITECNCAVKE